MFDRTFIAPTVERTSYVTKEIHEHRAPTDQSVALLKEMEEAARAKLIESVKVTDTNFECVVHTLKEFASGDFLCKAVFSLNGEKLEAEVRTQDTTDRQKVWTALRDEIARVIAGHILTGALRRLA